MAAGGLQRRLDQADALVGLWWAPHSAKGMPGKQSPPRRGLSCANGLVRIRSMIRGNVAGFRQKYCPGASRRTDHYECGDHAHCAPKFPQAGYFAPGGHAATEYPARTFLWVGFQITRPVEQLRAPGNEPRRPICTFNVLET
jgi:hypothetical protein